MSSISIESLSEVNDPRLGLPNSSSICSSCGAKELRRCEGTDDWLDSNFSSSGSELVLSQLSKKEKKKGSVSAQLII